MIGAPLPQLLALEALAVLPVELSCANEKYHWAYVKEPSKEKMSLVLEKSHHLGHSWLLGQSCILNTTS